jgi:hypothetical protein
MNWVEMLAWNQGCECIICCGDFFDSSVLNCEEISALQEVRWAPISHVFLTGNHESNINSLEYSTTDLFKLCPNSCVINTPQQYFIDNTTVEFCFLPYVLESDRKSIEEYFGKQSCNRVIFSHNDLKNVQYGCFLSTEGFDVADIENNCNLFFNGHIHNCANVSKKIFNVGNLTGQNFTEDALKYQHCAAILDTETLEYKLYQNLYALKFYKIDATDCKTVEELTHKLNDINSNGVATVSVSESLSDEARSILDHMKKDYIQEYRLLVKRDTVLHEDNVEAFSVNVDHLKQFESYVRSNIGNDTIIEEELLNIMRG